MPYPKITHEQHMKLVRAIRGAEGEALYGKRVVVYLNLRTGASRIWDGSKRRPWPRPTDSDEVEIWRSEPHTLKQLYSKDKNFQYINWKDPNLESTVELTRLFLSHTNGEFGFKFPLGEILNNAYENYNINGVGLSREEIGLPPIENYEDEIDYSELDDE